MEKSPIQQIDIVLHFFKKDRGHINFDNLRTRLWDGDKKITIDGDVLLRILEKLVRDKYVYEKKRDMGGVDYAITFEGSLFIGYEKQQKLDTEKIVLSDNLKVAENRYKNRLLWATWCAGVAASLVLLWQVWIWFYPVHANYPYWIWETIPKHK
ncbi:hypothetical protein [Mucilaginibacter kameinonensis]|uniref:hypothetical protein n=1 Tax=Mucilaginibacter kameinonensis TaxID=452286 RepID=UPI000EF84D02|nr:hypothetical protein [Mucilaginibacter kameinonensis]